VSKDNVIDKMSQDNQKLMENCEELNNLLALEKESKAQKKEKWQNLKSKMNSTITDQSQKIQILENEMILKEKREYETEKAAEEFDEKIEILTIELERIKARLEETENKKFEFQ
jgi:hypothetical protein